MSKGWSPSDKDAARNLARKAKAAAEKETIRQAKDMRLEHFDDLWDLEVRINRWRSELKHAFGIEYESFEKSACNWLRRGWLDLSDLGQLSEQRRERIKHTYRAR